MRRRRLWMKIVMRLVALADRVGGSCETAGPLLRRARCLRHSGREPIAPSLAFTLQHLGDGLGFHPLQRIEAATGTRT